MWEWYFGGVYKGFKANQFNVLQAHSGVVVPSLFARGARDKLSQYDTNWVAQIVAGNVAD